MKVGAVCRDSEKVKEGSVFSLEGKEKGNSIENNGNYCKRRKRRGRGEGVNHKPYSERERDGRMARQSR